MTVHTRKRRWIDIQSLSTVIFERDIIPFFHVYRPRVLVDIEEDGSVVIGSQVEETVAGIKYETEIPGTLLRIFSVSKPPSETAPLIRSGLGQPGVLQIGDCQGQYAIIGRRRGGDRGGRGRGQCRNQRWGRSWSRGQRRCSRRGWSWRRSGSRSRGRGLITERGRRRGQGGRRRGSRRRRGRRERRLCGDSRRRGDSGGGPRRNRRMRSNKSGRRSRRGRPPRGTSAHRQRSSGADRAPHDPLVNSPQCFFSLQPDASQRVDSGQVYPKVAPQATDRSSSPSYLVLMSV